MKDDLRKKLIAVLVLVVATCGVGYGLFGQQIKAINTIARLDDGLYYLEYVGDYGFSGFLEKGGGCSDQDIVSYLSSYLTRGLYKFKAPVQIGGCSTIAVANPTRGYLFGRNFDWEKCTALIVKTVPQDGYASFSTANIGFVGASPEPQGLLDKFVYLGSLYAPLDGMNEQGLVVAVLVAGDGPQTNQNTGKVGLTTTTAVRLLLDRAANVEEAIELLGQYDMHASAELEYHLAIADAQGASVVVEYLDNVMHVLEEPVVTNHFLLPGLSETLDQSSSTAQRFAILQEVLAEAGGVMAAEQVKEALEAARQEGEFSTQWSIVYAQTERRLAFYHRRDYNRPLSFQF